MRHHHLIILTFIVLLTNLDNVNGQDTKAYVESIEQYTVSVDSLIKSYYQNPETTLAHTITHQVCSAGNGGGSTDLYQDVERKNVYQLKTSNNCNSISTDTTFYFLKNKIVFIVINVDRNGHRQTKTKCYRADKLITTKASRKKKSDPQSDKDLKSGYDLLASLTD